MQIPIASKAKGFSDLHAPPVMSRYRHGIQAERPSQREENRSGMSKVSHARLNEFFLVDEGIHREVLQSEICKYLGPEATARPTTYNVGIGFGRLNLFC